MLGVWQRLVLFLVYGQLLTGVWGNQIWFEILGKVLSVRILSQSKLILVDNWGKLEKDETIGTNYRNLLKYLDYENKHRDVSAPSTKNETNGRRKYIKQTQEPWKMLTIMTSL
jgi:hypothetical protein